MNVHMAEALIDLEQLAHNIRTTRARLGRCKLLFPVKANAYGHGAVEVARVAQACGVDYFGVANVAEALELRARGIHSPVLIFSASRLAHVSTLVEAEVDVSVSSAAFATALNLAARARKRRVRVQIKVDTGMGRNGVWWERALSLARTLATLPALECVGIFTHFSASYSTSAPDHSFSIAQLDAFKRLLASLEQEGLLPPLRHIANSSGLVQYEDRVTTGYFNMVRPGILLYGAPELGRPWTRSIQPILSLRTWITSLDTLEPGRTIGYGRAYETTRTTRVASLPVGYADGVSWWLKNRGQVWIKGQRAPLVGGVSMDQLTVDVSHINDLNVDDEVYLIHPELPAAEVAQTLGANFSEVVLTALSGRVARVYLNNAPSPCPVSGCGVA